MGQRSIRFGVNDGKRHRASSWKCWVETGAGKNDVYLTCRRLGGVLKVSLHASGSWHVAFDSTAFPALFEEADKPTSRFVTKWNRPPELPPGVVLACRVIVPWYAPTVLEHPPDPEVTWIHTASHGKAVEFFLILTSSTTPVTDWPARRSMRTELVGQLTLDSGDRVWVVYHVIDWADSDPLRGKPRFAKGRTHQDLKSSGLRALAWRQEPDGSMLFLDAPVIVTRES